MQLIGDDEYRLAVAVSGFIYMRFVIKCYLLIVGEIQSFVYSPVLSGIEVVAFCECPVGVGLSVSPFV